MNYKYTSCLKRLNLVKEDSLLADHEVINNIENYKEFLEEKNIHENIIEEKTRTGKPCCSESFYDNIKTITGIDYKKKIRP